MKAIITLIFIAITLSASGQIKRPDFYDSTSKVFNTSKFDNHKRNAGVRTIAIGGIFVGIGAAFAPISSNIISNALERKSKESSSDYSDYAKQANKQQKTCNVISGITCLAGVVTILAGLDTLRDFPLAKNIRIENRPGGVAIAYVF
jgi:hypothetical protein